jgi:hypothetical protein
MSYDYRQSCKHENAAGEPITCTESEAVDTLEAEIAAAERDVIADHGQAVLDEGYSDLVHAVMQSTSASPAAKREVLTRKGLLEYSWAPEVLA